MLVPSFPEALEETKQLEDGKYIAKCTKEKMQILMKGAGVMYRRLSKPMTGEKDTGKQTSNAKCNGGDRKRVFDELYRLKNTNINLKHEVDTLRERLLRLED